jgi:hypothetical protein
MTQPIVADEPLIAPWHIVEFCACEDRRSRTTVLVVG